MAGNGMRRIAPGVLEDDTMRIERVGARGWAAAVRMVDYGADRDMRTGYLVGRRDGPLLGIGTFPTRGAAEEARRALFSGGAAFDMSGSGPGGIVHAGEAERALAATRPPPRGRFPFSPF